jgi:hypothetical protein
MGGFSALHFLMEMRLCQSPFLFLKVCEKGGNIDYKYQNQGATPKGLFFHKQKFCKLLYKPLFRSFLDSFIQGEEPV